MTERGLYLDLARMQTGALNARHHIYIVQREHRLHTVLSTLEALNYTDRRYGVGEHPESESAWSLTEQGLELYLELQEAYRKKSW